MDQPIDALDVQFRGMAEVMLKDALKNIGDLTDQNLVDVLGALLDSRARAGTPHSHDGELRQVLRWKRRRMRNREECV